MKQVSSNRSKGSSPVQSAITKANALIVRVLAFFFFFFGIHLKPPF